MATFELTRTLRGSLSALRGVPADVASYRLASDDALVDASRAIGELERVLAGHRALVAGEIARRSSAEFGYGGMAQRAGHRTVEDFLSSQTGATLRDTTTDVRAGRALHDSVELPDARTGEIIAPATPWMRPVADAVAAGVFGSEHVASIRRGLGDPGEGVTAELLRRAAETLCAEAVDAMTVAPDDSPLTPRVVPDADRVFRRARALRDELDAAGIAERERARFAKRSFTVVPQPDGMTRISWLLDPESAGYVVNLYDRITSPKRGGPRFVDPALQATADRVELDPRTPAQYASDVFLDLLRAGSSVDATELLGAEGAAVQIIVVDEQLERPDGHGWLVGQTDPVSRETVERHLCTGGHQRITVTPDGDPLDVGRTRRLHTKKQRTALAIRDGGCRVDGCHRGIGMVEAHHIDHWVRDHGETSVERGILLCRYHHLRIHNEGWEIEKHGGEFVLVPPPNIDPARRPVPLPRKSPIRDDLARRRAG